VGRLKRERLYWNLSSLCWQRSAGILAADTGCNFFRHCIQSGMREMKNWRVGNNSTAIDAIVSDKVFLWCCANGTLMVQVITPIMAGSSLSICLHRQSYSSSALWRRLVSYIVISDEILEPFLLARMWCSFEAVSVEMIILRAVNEGKIGAVGTHYDCLIINEDLIWIYFSYWGLILKYR